MIRKWEQNHIMHACGCSGGVDSSRVPLKYTGAGELPKVFVAPVSKGRFLVNRTTKIIAVPREDAPGFLAMQAPDTFVHAVQ